MKFGGLAIVLLAGGIIAGALVAPAEAKRPSHRPAFAPPARPVYVAPAEPLRAAPVWGANGYRFDPPAAAPFAPSPYGN